MNIRTGLIKFLSMLLAAVMLVSACSFSIFADNDDTDSDIQARDADNTAKDEDKESGNSDKKTDDNADSASDEEEDEETDTFNYLSAENVFSTADEKLHSMTLRTSAYGYELYCDEYTGEVAIKNTASGQTLFTNPYDLASSPSSDDVKGQLLSQIELRYSDSTGTKKSMFSYTEACKKNQIKIKNLKNGVRVEYSLGDEEVRYLVPMVIEKTRFEERILPFIEKNSSAKRNFRSYYVLKDPNDSSLSQREINEMYDQYPITADMAVYVFDNTASAREIKKIEGYIKSLCKDYTFAALEEDHQLTKYTSTQKPPALFKMALEYYIDEQGLQVRLPANGIRFDEDEYQLTYVRILPYFGAGSSDFDGYTFLPDGSGALFDFQQLKGQNVNITGKVYGTDYSYHEIGTTKSQTMRFPVYGVVEKYQGNSATFKTVDVPETTDEETGKVIPAHTEEVVDTYTPLTEDRGFFAVIEEGDSLASLTTMHGGNLHRYNSVYTEFNPRPSDSYNLSDAVSVGDDTVWTIVSDRKYTGSYRIRVFMLTDEATAEKKGLTDYYPASYVGMASAYRDYLEGEGILKAKEQTNEDIPLYIESFGAVEADSTFLSIPTKVKKALTTFDNLKTMYNELSDKGVSNVNFRLTGFVNGGMESTVPTKAKFEKAVGGNDGYKDFASFAEEKGITVYPEFDLSYQTKDEAFDGYKMSRDAVKTIDNRYSMKRTYLSSYQQTLTTGLICVSPSVFGRLYDGITDDIAKLGKSGISLSTLGSDLNSDFDSSDSYNREDSKELVLDLLKKSSEDYKSVMVDGGNAYTWRYADTILNVSLDSSRYTSASRSIPFIGMVLHGYMNFAGEPTNMASDSDYEFLKMIENGSLPYFTLSYQNTPLLKEDSNLSKYYSVAYDIWVNDLVSTYKEINEALKDVSAAKIVNHEFIEGKRVISLEEQIEDEKAVEEARIAEEKAAKELAEKLARAQALAARLGTSVQDVSSDADSDNANAGLKKNNLTAEELEAENASKYVINDGTIVRVTYDNGTVFLLNYNRFEVSADGQKIPALGFVKLTERGE